MAKKVIEETASIQDASIVNDVVEEVLVQSEVMGDALPELTEENKDVEKTTDSTITVELNLSQEDQNEIKRQAYEKVMDRYHVDYDRIVDSAQTSFTFQTNEQILALVEVEKKAETLFPKLIDVYLAELKRRGVDVTELQDYFDGIDYTEPWKRL